MRGIARLGQQSVRQSRMGASAAAARPRADMLKRARLARTPALGVATLTRNTQAPRDHDCQRTARERTSNAQPRRPVCRHLVNLLSPSKILFLFSSTFPFPFAADQEPRGRGRQETRAGGRGTAARAPASMSSTDENPIPRLDACCGCIQLKMGVLVLCILQMIASVFMMLLIGSYILFGSAPGDTLPLMGGAYTMFALIVVLLLTAAEFGFALYAFSDIRKAEAQGIRYYYMFKVVSLGLSLLVFMLTSDWTSPEILNLFLSTTISLYCIWCIWSLHEALMLGGEAAAKAGFTPEEASQGSPLWTSANAKKTDAEAGDSKDAGYQSSAI